ncbi:hypothetical protein [Halobacteriovorax sp. JY17]|uniref:hypothetical protein n=1 Tax=Halobacteriovorax sp. JY17 TaxID=2014617 RepID=UPI000C6004AD|nr:hypothetical protein [Halobacteriovorax sp. JY17]PIK15314.1 MAG: hypothetical protein CES88_00965 [Halobacteriovorax sp. JY17]
MAETKRLLTLITLSALLFTSCVGEGGSGRKTRFSNNSTTDLNGGTGGDTGGNSGATPGSGDTIGEDGGVSIGSQVELMHLVDPFDGTYKKKLTLPKNFTGLLYLSGLNISSLSDRLVYARFVFGKEYEPVTVAATIGRAPGITPQTDVEVVILDMANHPFENMRLSYNLFDYNEYADEGRANGLADVVSDPRDPGLYCRGLHAKDDKTFESGVGNSSCDTAGEVCKYTYARVEDIGLYYDTDTASLPFAPTEPHVALASNDYEAEPFSNSIKRCLPDTIDKAINEKVLGVTFTGGFGYGVKVDTNGGVCGDDPGEDCYTYYGPYRDIDRSSWQISGAAIYSDTSAATAPTGIYKKSFGVNGYESFLFPRAGKMELQSGVEYIGSATPFVGTSFDTTFLTASGESDYLFGCSMRATNYDSNTQEGIGSCNVTARVELFTKDATGQETIITQSNNIVLQLIRPSLTDYRGQEVLYTSMKSCSSSQTCGGSECCFNNRCWSKELVSQCLEDVPVVGNKGVGESCQTDYECSSICCNQTTGSCAVHLNTEDEQVFCSKSPGQSCVAKEWCRQENVPNCFIVKTGANNVGQPTCALRCYNVPTFGDCTNGTCTPPEIPPVPAFDPSNPDCSEAINPPTFN